MADLATALLVACAVLVTALVVRREFFSSPPGAEPTFRQVENAHLLLTRDGQVLGPLDAPVRIVEFSDFQCPFCAQVQKDLRRVRERFPADVAVAYRHFPIDAIHPHARGAALAAECAGSQGRFEAYHDALYSDQQGIGVRDWESFAEAAAVPDLQRFNRCVAEGGHLQQIARDVSVGDSIGVKATPTFILNGRMFSGTLPEDEWVRLINEELAHR
jgi:protein-disulfide isomerase